MTLAAVEILHCASQFDRRVHQTTRTYPLKILLLVQSHPNQECNVRKTLANEILDSNDAELNVVALKVKHLYTQDLLLAARTGRLGNCLAAALMEIRRVWQPDVRECERINKGLTLLSSRSPNSSSELVSARTMIKHYLGSAVRGKDLTESQKKKWSTFKPVASDLMQLCLASWDDKEQILSKPDRWTTPKPSTAPSAKECLGCLCSSVLFLYFFFPRLFLVCCLGESLG